MRLDTFELANGTVSGMSVLCRVYVSLDDAGVCPRERDPSRDPVRTLHTYSCSWVKVLC